jgi:hypothetical protein
MRHQRTHLLRMPGYQRQRVDRTPLLAKISTGPPPSAEISRCRSSAMVDGVCFAERTCVVALGIGIDGTKHPLALSPPVPTPPGHASGAARITSGGNVRRRCNCGRWTSSTSCWPMGGSTSWCRLRAGAGQAVSIAGPLLELPTSRAPQGSSDLSTA